MDSCKSVIWLDNPPLSRVGASPSQCSKVEPAHECCLYTVTEQGLEVASPTCADTCSTTEGWADGESDDDHDSGKESTPTTSGPGTPTTATTVGSVCETMMDPKPAAPPEVDPSVLEFEFARMMYSSPPLYDEYPKLVRASITENHETTEDVEMKESRDAFEQDVMPYYFSAILANGCDPIFEVPSPPSNPPIPPSGSAEYDLGGYSTRIEKQFANVFSR